MINWNFWRLLLSTFVVICTLLRNVAWWTRWIVGLNPWDGVGFRGVLIDVLEGKVWFSLSIVLSLDSFNSGAVQLISRIYSILDVFCIDESWRVLWLICSSTACCIILGFVLNQFAGSLNRSCFLTRVFWWWNNLVLCLLSIALTISFLFSSRLFLILQLLRVFLLLLKF